jgi:molecular chaperone DnaJ
VSRKIKVKRKIQAPGVSYKTCGTCNGQGQVMRVTNTILGRMQSASTCPTVVALAKLSTRNLPMPMRKG